jgi:hypothetical protein
VDLIEERAADCETADVGDAAGRDTRHSNAGTVGEVVAQVAQHFDVEQADEAGQVWFTTNYRARWSFVPFDEPLLRNPEAADALLDRLTDLEVQAGLFGSAWDR